ncbi:DUF5107 domain-containing protein [Microbacterium oryzae]|uniref:DUF5107 domain-containing protein n=1 Tax=Microbacterium oryzae TaxID=743009 RepID=UPI0025B1F2B4|nr:DUF5107 domain-containing protein [Microbacterium oryzae]MDN3310897.1 DUF5107 domain-containing protein [Microbacterium oryzae]
MTEDLSRICLPGAPADQRDILDAGGVACWEEDVVIDTYDPAAPDRYPLFLDRRVYQGSSGKVYPLPMTDAISHEKRPRRWRAIHLENAYVRLMLLPEIGGRIHIGYDKVADYDFFYRNNVIKPALVGLAGPWISGGVEFNWPQHHRPATFLPVETSIEREADGAVVVWHGDIDPLQRMQSVHGVRLRPGSTLIEADVRLHNRTDAPQTFLWWANVAARSHEQYQSFFPDDVTYVADHARRAITAFPRADRPYYGVDYPALAAEREGADRIDIYSNIPVPTSYMITDTDDEFFGGYDHGADAGFVHWADHALSPGKKQWTWGDGEIGRAWDDQLTDGDGPYVELMAGVYTDNQPDFAWLLPGETRTFSQYWYPIHDIGPARQASLDAAISVRPDGDGTRVGVLVTRAFPEARIEIVVGEDVREERVSLAPDAPVQVAVPAAAVDCVVVRTADRVLAQWQSERRDHGAPWVATAPPQPEQIESADELYLTAVHLMQYRHPSRSAVAYLEEALRRDESDLRAATLLAGWRLRRAEYDDARVLLERAMARQTRRNLNPRDGETGYLLGLVLERLGDFDEAERVLGRAAWNAAWQPAATLVRARITLRRGDAARALAIAREVAAVVPAARRIEVLALRRLGEDSSALLQTARTAAPLDPGFAALDGALASIDPRTPLEIGAEFALAGALREALAVTESAARRDHPGFGVPEPLRHYLRAHWLDQAGPPERADEERSRARAAAADYAFPAGLDQHDALVAALVADPGDVVAHGLLGMWLLDAGRSADALSHLAAATEGGSIDPVVWRNHALAVVATGGDPAAADRLLERALALAPEARLVFEREVLDRVRGLSARERLSRLEEHADLLDQRDDLAVVHANLLLDVGRNEEAWRLLTTRRFRPFEGGEGRALAAYDRAACRIAAAHSEARAAIALLEEGVAAPAHLGEGRHPADPIAERLVLLGDLHRQMGDDAAAESAWQRACARSPLAVDERPADERDYWIGVAHSRLGEYEEARAVWARLEARADELERTKDVVDYFATSVPELLLFDTDTSGARIALARQLRELAARGRHPEGVLA